MTMGMNWRNSPAETLYDLLCVRPGDDAETLQSAFRNAAKASHPDLNPGDPDASQRFRQINTAYAILRDATRRAAYDRLLALDRTRRRAQLKRTIVSKLAVIAAVTLGVVGTYSLFTLAKTSVEVAKVVEVAAQKLGVQIWVEIAGGDQLPNLPEIAVAPRPVASRMSSLPPVIAGGRPAETYVVQRVAETNRRSEPRGETGPADAPIVSGAVTPAAKTNAPLIIANVDPVPNSIVDRPHAKDGAEDQKRNEGLDPVDQNGARLAEQRSSSWEKDKGLVRSSSSGTGAKLQVLAKRPVTSRTSTRQASFEGTGSSQIAFLNRNPPNHPTPLFGVGF
jgi:DnaJ domain